jgi:hypothetical protein
MKKFIAGGLLFTLFFTLSLPTLAQKRRAPIEPIIKGEVTQFERVEAATDSLGALIKWQVSGETRNAGYFVYRQGGKGLELVSDVMVPGSGARPAKDTASGGAYETFDPNGGLGTVYVIQSVSMDGNRVMSDPFTTTFNAALEGMDSQRTASDRKSKNSNVERTSLDLPEELKAEVQSFEQLADLNTHRWVVSQPGAKIGVRKDGVYRVTRTELQAAGFNVSSNSANWRLFMEGVEQAIIVGPGDQYIDFYGKGIDTVESDTRVYYLLADVTGGKRIATKVIRPIGGTVVSKNYLATAEKKERISYMNQFRNGDAENYWGRVIGTAPSTINFTITGLDAVGGKLPFLLKMHGYTESAHTVTVVLNGNTLQPATGNGSVPFSLSGSFPPSLLQEGNNTLTLNTASGFVLFDSFTVTHPRKYVADQNRVSFYTPGLRNVDLGGFTSPNIRVFDTTRDGDPVQVTNLQIVQQGATHTVKLPSHRAMVMYGVEDSGLLQSPAVTRNNGSTLSTASNSGQMLIISHSAADFMAAAEIWADYRRSSAGGSLNVKVIDVADIFDEYSYGLLSSAAINSFLNYAKNNWTVQPQYVLLIGDASYDPRNYEGLGYNDMVPTKIVNLVYAESGSDEALADFDNDGLAELAIGRIPSKTAAGVTTMFNKTTAFETPAMQSFSRGAVFAYDIPDGYDFRAISEVLRNELPQSMPVTYFPRGLPAPFEMTPDPAGPANLINALNNPSGKYIVNWAGHGSLGLWGNSPGLFQTAGVPQLSNGSSQSIFMMLTCLNGYFLHVQHDSISEALVKLPTGGGVVAWASSEKTTADGQLLMGTRFLNKLNAGIITRMGDLVRDAKTAVPGGSDVRYSWVLLGDPALKVR